MKSPMSCTIPWCIALLFTTLAAHVVEAQTSRDRREQVSPQQLEKRIEKAEEVLLKEYMEVATELYNQDEKEESLEVLLKIQRINPRMTGLKERMDLVKEELMNSNEIEVEINTGKGWGVAIANVTADKTFRLQAIGEYKLTLTATVPLTGLPTENPEADYAKQVPFGALMGVIVTDGKPGDPFPVSANGEHTPKKSGQLFLRVNVPFAAKCTGDLKVRMTGAVSAVSKRR